MFANSYAPPLAADALRGAGQSRVAAARRLLASCLTPDRSHCVEAIDVLGVDWLRRQSLAPLIWQTCRDDLPSTLQAELHAAYYAAAGDAELHRHELLSVLQTLAAHNLVPVVFKGAALAYTVYPDPACRPMGDLDLWIQASELPPAQQALCELGYRKISNPDRPPELMERFGGEIHMSGVDDDEGLIELHLSVFLGEWLRRTTAIDEAAVRERVVRSTWNEMPIDLLSVEDALIQLVTHLAINHQLSFFPLRSLVDIVLLARHYPIDWNVIVQRARDWRVATVVWLVLNLAVDLAGLEEAHEAVRQLQPSALRQRMIRRFASAENLVEMRDLSASNWRYVFLLLLVDRKRDALKLIYRALWPEREWLQARYGRYTFATRLHHLFDAARGKI